MAHKTANGNGNGMMERRRQAIASLLVRKPKASQREIQEWVGHNILNPDTGEPYSLGTINNDLRVIRETWRERAQADYADWVAEELARIEEVEAAAWKRDDMELVLKCSDRRCKLLGLYAPNRQEVSGPEGGDIQIVLTGNISPDDL